MSKGGRHHERVDDLFHEALELPPERRSAFLDEACGDEPDLRREVVSLLAALETATDFMEAPAFDLLAEAPEHDPNVGRQIGRYRIERVIGRGGMGNVYLAERADEAFHKQVAIKLIRRGMDTDDILRRFRNERQVLANLEHPNIARLIDGGSTDDGLPYLAMEYVQGTRLDRYCDEHRLSVDRRLDLFRTVCAAVQYAHQNLVVHRDLKPGNILVTGAGEVKLLDFGIARVLSPDAPVSSLDATAAAQRRLTPAYASPEQIRGEPTTTSTDVYALGVVLYELLTGRRPYALDSTSPREIERAICEDPPTAPSAALTATHVTAAGDDDADALTTIEEISARRSSDPSRLRRTLRGDLENIMLMALRKEPERRYRSVEQLAEDIRRYRARLPVIARPDTLGYRTGRFVSRHRLPLAAAVIFVLLLMGAIVGVSWQAHIASRERDRAQRRFDDVRALANTLVFDIHDELVDLPGTMQARKLLAERGAQYLDLLAQEAGDDVELLKDLATGYERLGRVQRSLLGSDLGESDAAFRNHDLALTIRTRLVELAPEDREARRALAQSHTHMGDMHRVAGDLSAALEHYEQAARTIRPLGEQHPDDDQLATGLAAAYLKLGIVYGDQGRFDDARLSYEAARGVIETIVQRDPSNQAARRNIGICDERIGDLYQVDGDASSAHESYLRALETYRALAADSGNPLHRMTLAIAHLKLAEVRGHPSYSNLGDIDGALESLDEGIGILGDLIDADPKDARARRVLGVLERNVGILLAEADRFEEAEAAFERARAISQRLADDDPGNAAVARDVAMCRKGLGVLSAERGEYEPALEHLRAAERVFEAHRQADPTSRFTRQDVASVSFEIGRALLARASDAPGPERRAADGAAALESLERSQTLYRAMQADGSLVTNDEPLLAELVELIEQCRAHLAASG